MNKSLGIIFLVCIQYSASGQQSFTLDSCMRLFKQHNLLLLAEHYQVSAAKAAVIQARIWQQPYFTGELNALNPQDNKVFDAGKNGEKTFALQQLIYLGRKKKREVDFAKSNIAIAELAFEQLLLQLRHQLSQTFYAIYFDQQKIHNIDIQSVELDSLAKAYQVQVDKGNLPLKELVRLQALLLTLKNDRSIVQKEIFEREKELQILTGTNDMIAPVTNDRVLIRQWMGASFVKDSLLALALLKYPEYLLATKELESQELYLKWQQSLAVPDLTSGLSYDQRGGAFNHQVNLTFGLPLRLWNSNKGNIRIAESTLMQSRISNEYKKSELQKEVEAAWKIWVQQQQQLLSIDPSVEDNLEKVYTGILANFQKRNISFLEFTDFMESFHQSNIQLNEMKKQLILAGLQLNFITNTDLL